MPAAGVLFWVPGGQRSAMKRLTAANVPRITPPFARCPKCDSTRVQAYTVYDTFTYGTAKNTTNLSVELPSYRCSDCKLEFPSEDAERLRYAAVCDHLGLLDPARIAAIRMKYGLSRAKFAAVSRVGTVSLARWECGKVRQGAAMDAYLRLLARPEIYELVASGAIFKKNS